MLIGGVGGYAGYSKAPRRRAQTSASEGIGCRARSRVRVSLMAASHPVAEAESAGGRVGALVGGAGAVASQHLSGIPLP